MDTNDEREVDRLIAEHFPPLRPNGEWQPDLRRGLALLRERRMANNRRPRRWGLIAVVTLAACLPIVAFPGNRTFAKRCVSACVEETTAVRQFLMGGPGPSSTYVKAGDRKPAPDFTLSDASGQPVRLSDFRGKVVLLNFWATWCSPCEQEIPWFVEFERANRDRGFTVLGVSMDEGGWAAVKPYIDRKRINYPVMIGDGNVAGLFGGLHAIPLTLIIDRAGRIAAIHAGLCRRDEYEGDIVSVLNENESLLSRNAN
jgi:peroxiredoxin